MLLRGEFLIGQRTREICIPNLRHTPGILAFGLDDMVHCGCTETETVM
ncbi:hypothetical protein BH23GEM8_BH23GEM8_03530 [soil metagenome]